MVWMRGGLASRFLLRAGEKDWAGPGGSAAGRTDEGPTDFFVETDGWKKWWRETARLHSMRATSIYLSTIPNPNYQNT